MHLRLATTRDLSRISDITISSLQDDPFFDYIWPNRHEFPDDNAFFWNIHLKKLLYDPRMTFLLVELQDGDDSDESRSHARSEKHERAAHGPTPRTVISYGIWERIGKEAVAKRRARKKNTWQNKFDALTAWQERWSISRKYTRRDGSPARQAASDVVDKAVRRDYFEGAGIHDWWSMELLVTDRQYRGRGAASSIVRWGCEVADPEGCFAGVCASPMGEVVYAMAGFEKKGTETVKVEGETDEVTFTVMLRPPHTGRKRSCNLDPGKAEVVAPFPLTQR
ncbi:hypothetical protein B0T21DRAFT_375086 [Apiosordaria backusii]|uniref:N-acetyltransferase domain-containing protein n=1 Tax=Apiosordaria backusii TaxID=314023 RepID=A0AA40AIP0_9PEZI|nr:hypothetical protein B0T21DRAFT_375086 [Apiosordaria backusii]